MKSYAITITDVKEYVYSNSDKYKVYKRFVFKKKHNMVRQK